MSEEEYQRYQEAVGFLFEAGADDEAGIYLEALRRGATLLTVTTNPQHVSEVRKLMDDHGAADIAGRAEQWRSSGWKSFDRSAKPMTPAEVAVAKAK